MRAEYALSVFLSFVSFAALAQENPSKAMLDELRAAPIAKAQSDLDTTQLASARRERETSVSERTNGLWQSWVVAICQGCGVRERQHSRQDVDELVGRAEARLKTAPAAQSQVARMPTRTVRPLDALEGRGPGLTTGSIGQASDTRTAR